MWHLTVFLWLFDGISFDSLLISQHIKYLVFKAEYQLQERYFDVLVKKEQMEEKMKGVREMKCRAVTCKKVPSISVSESAVEMIGGSRFCQNSESDPSFPMSLCFQCGYTYFKPADRCVGENHDLRWHDAVKRFFKCPCGQRAIALDRLPHKHCR